MFWMWLVNYINCACVYLSCKLGRQSGILELAHLTLIFEE